MVALASAAGVAAEHRFGHPAERGSAHVLNAMLWVLVPPITFVNVARLELDERVAAGVAFGGIALVVALLTAYVIGRRLLALPPPGVGALMLVAAFGNTGFLGLPFVAALFGGGELANAIVYDLLLTTIGIFTVGFSIGAAFGAHGGETRDRVRSFFTRNPPLWASVAGLLAPSALAPDWALDASHVLVYALPLLGFYAVGVTMAAEAEGESASMPNRSRQVKFPPRFTRAVAVALAIKLLLVPGIVLGLSAALIDIPDSYGSQAAMASAINCLVIAHQFGLDRALVAGVIAWSTGIVVAAGLVASLL